MIKRYIVVFVIVLLAMVVWWREAFTQMIANQSMADMVLFLTMALSSSFIGFFSISLLFKSLGVANNVVLKVLLSSAMSFFALWAISLKLTGIMRIT